uniref:Ovule protein n=1 Tax=Haemonchus placei TaxID=6290 RepID=A0A0N4X6J4_HAEPC
LKSTKLRIVFDVSSHAKGEYFFNDWFSNSARKAFLQIRLPKEHGDVARLLWIHPFLRHRTITCTFALVEFLSALKQAQRFQINRYLSISTISIGHCIRAIQPSLREQRTPQRQNSRGTN